MKAMVLRKVLNLEVDNSPLQLVDMDEPVPGEKEMLVRVSRCAVCHTELDEIEGRTPPLHFPIILGHQIVGRVERTGRKAKRTFSCEKYYYRQASIISGGFFRLWIRWQVDKNQKT